jgi:hypothetical protein
LNVLKERESSKLSSLLKPKSLQLINNTNFSHLSLSPLPSKHYTVL